MPEKEVAPVVIKANQTAEVPVGVIKVKELLSRHDSSQMSVSIVDLDGDNTLGRNTRTDAAYFVLDGQGTFTLGVDGRLDVYEVQAGDLVFIPKGVMYKDTGRMKLLAINTPAYDPEARGMGQPEEMVQDGVVIGANYEHCEGGRYRVLSVDLDATHYEETGQVKPVVRYEQLYQGKFPPGTVWVRDLADFLGATEQGAKKFTLTQENA